LALVIAAFWIPFPFPPGLGYAAPDAKVQRRAALALGLLPQAVSAKEFPIVAFDVDVEGGDGPETEQVVIQLRPDWSPRGVKRFKQLLKFGDLEGSPIHHVKKSLDTSGVWFGFPAEPKPEPEVMKREWISETNKRGRLSFHTKEEGEERQAVQMFINTANNRHLDGQGVAPFAEVLQGMDTVDKIYGGYGEYPEIDKIKYVGKKYLDKEFPKLGKIVSAGYAEKVAM